MSVFFCLNYHLRPTDSANRVPPATTVVHRHSAAGGSHGCYGLPRRWHSCRCRPGDALRAQGFQFDFGSSKCAGQSALPPLCPLTRLWFAGLDFLIARNTDDLCAGPSAPFARFVTRPAAQVRPGLAPAAQRASASAAQAANARPPRWLAQCRHPTHVLQPKGRALPSPRTTRPPVQSAGGGESLGARDAADGRSACAGVRRNACSGGQRCQAAN
jgi:hypothetical protein